MSRGAQMLVRAALAVLLAGAVSACGRRGGLEPPPDPSVAAASPSDESLSQLRRPRQVPITPPHERFILDPLL